jgi:anti-anti-sigma factor
MEVVIKDTGDDLTTVALIGRLDSAGVDQVETRFTAATVARGANTIVDLTEVEFLASMGIRMFVACAKGLKRKGASMVLLGATALVSGVLKEMSLDDLIPMAKTEEEARAILAES